MSPFLGLVYLGILIVAVVIVVTVVRKKTIGQNKIIDEEPEPDLFQVEVMPESKDKKLDLADIKLEQTIGKLQDKECETFVDTYMPTSDGGTRVIHLMMLHQTGFYLFQSLQMQGWIIGSEDSRWWTRFTSPEKKNYFDNPIWRMDEDIQAMIDFFPKTKRDFFHPFIVVDDACELRDIKLSSDVQVINQASFETTLKTMLDDAETVLSEGNLAQLSRVLAVMQNGAGLEQRLLDLKRSMKEESERKRILREASIKEAEDRKKIEEKRIELAQTKVINPVVRPEDRFTRAELALRDALVLWREQEAGSQGIKPQRIFDNRALDAIVDMKPQTVQQLRTIPGFDAAKCNQYGYSILNMIRHSP